MAASGFRLFRENNNDRSATGDVTAVDDREVPSIADGGLPGAAPQREVWVEPDPPDEDKCEGGGVTQAEQAPVRGCSGKGAREREQHGRRQQWKGGAGLPFGELS